MKLITKIWIVYHFGLGILMMLFPNIIRFEYGLTAMLVGGLLYFMIRMLTNK